MDDLIRRQDAVNELSYCQTYLFDSRDHDKKISLEDAEYTIERLPSAQQWIPCFESLPKEDGLEVLFSSRFGRVHIGKYHDDASLNRWFSYRDKIRLMNNEVTAWMPLPEPYREEVSD